MKLFYEKYIKLAHIGKGANAHVFKVKHAEWGDVRAIKVLNNYIESKSDRAYESFLKECKTLLAIGSGQNPNILRIYGADLIDNHAIVEMDYVQGKSLYSYVKEKGFFDYEEVESFIHDIVGALAYTHHDIYKFLMDPEEDNLQLDPNDGKKYVISREKEAELVKKYGIAHNDLHSNNVMRRDYDGRFILLDFGLAVQDGKCIKSSGKADGHPEYMAPEKFDSGDITPRSDVYSLGVLMFEVLTGRPPFILEVDKNGIASQRANAKIRNEHLSQTPPSIFTLRKEAFESQIPGAVYERDYPEWLDGVVMKCLAKNPEDRYADAKELLDDIKWHVAHETQNGTEKSSSTDSNEPSEDSDNSHDTDIDSEVVDTSDKPRPKTNKNKLLFIIGGCVVLGCSILFYIREMKLSENVSHIYVPVKEYQLNVGDSLIIEASVQSPLAEDSIITWTPLEQGIVNVKGDTIIALKSGETALNASITWLTVESAVKITVIDDNDSPSENESQEKPMDNKLQVEDRKISNPDFSKKVEYGKTENPIKPIAENVSPESKRTDSNNNQQLSSINLGYGTWFGATKNGKPHGKGKLVFSSPHKVDSHSSVEANSGDYFEAVYENGRLVWGKLYDSNGNILKTIIP